jgi:hypothetical protein
MGDGKQLARWVGCIQMMAGDDTRIRTMRIVLGNNPRAYRETLAAALGVLRPQIEIVAVPPAELDAAIADQAPDFVVCSELTEAVETHALGWALLYPEGSSLCVITVRGERVSVPNVQLDTLLAIIDRTTD